VRLACDDGVAQGADGLVGVGVDLAVERFDRLERQSRGDLAGEVAAHPVGDGEHRVGDEVGVLVALADPTDVGASGGDDPSHRRTSTRVLPRRSWSPAASGVGG
jgi:hypothetical protein